MQEAAGGLPKRRDPALELGFRCVGLVAMRPVGRLGFEADRTRTAHAGCMRPRTRPSGWNALGRLLLSHTGGLVLARLPRCHGAMAYSECGPKRSIATNTARAKITMFRGKCEVSPRRISVAAATTIVSARQQAAI